MITCPDRTVPATPKVAIVHDYLTQRGGAERVVLAMLKAFPTAVIYTSLYQPETTFPEFHGADVRTLPLNRVGVLRRHHRLAFPFLAPAFSRLKVDAAVALCDSSGWSHGVRTTGRKVVYCHTPARWLYHQTLYLRRGLSAGRVALAVLGGPLRRWDRRAAGSADRYLTGSTEVLGRIAATYGRDAEILPSPPGIDPSGTREPVPGVEPGYHLVVARLLPYKNVAAVVEAFRRLPDLRLVVVGTGPEEAALRAAAGPNVTFLGAVGSDAQIRWLYGNCTAVVAAAHEDQGLIPIEAAGFGKPSAALRWGGFVDSVVDGTTGVFFDEPDPEAIAAAVRRLAGHHWSPDVLIRHADRFSEQRFIARLRAIVAEELAGAAPLAVSR
ncbi:MAG TPA: glycosyltransferase [Dermatophilaceae bacterium]|nr:glycosyltransferase [Dermatophilaceae bacterium]